jgi:hypothetical protein
VAIVNEAWAKVNLGDANPVGHSVISFGLGNTKPQQMEIVGLARNAKNDDLTGDFPAVVYLPFEQNPNVPGYAIQLQIVPQVEQSSRFH